MCVGKLTHEDIKSNDVAAGFATVEESSVGKKQVTRGLYDYFSSGFSDKYKSINLIDSTNIQQKKP